MSDLNVWADVSSIAQSVQSDAYFIVREAALMPQLVTTFTDMRGMNTRKTYKYNAGTALDISDSDDLTSKGFAPEADQTLTPSEIGLQYFISDARADSDLPENIINDASRELGFAAADKIETDLINEMANLTGGSLGASGTAITWGYVAAAIAQARNANKNAAKPLACVIHGYQWAVLAKAASVAGASVINGPALQDSTNANGGGAVLVANFMKVPIYQVFGGISGSDFTGGVFPREAIAIDWRRPVRIEPDRKPSRRGWELNMSAIYAHGVLRPTLGVKMVFDASAPTS